MTKWCVVLAVALSVASLVRCAKDGDKFAFASYYQSHMVLQQSPEAANVWGIGSMGEVVTLTMTGANVKKVYKTKVVEGHYPDLNTKAGVWRLTLAPTKAGGPYSIQIQDESGGVAKIDDVMFGDVWYCGGQSNMVFPVKNVINGSAEVASADAHSDVRIITMKRAAGQVPRTDIVDDDLPWSVSSSALLGGPGTSGRVSAVCWLYGRYLHQQLNYPIGLVHNSWGGTPIEKWSSSDSLAKCSAPKNKVNSEIFNNMVHPFMAMTFKGVVWYQGETNSHKPFDSLYECTFPKMINDWREKFNKQSGGQTNRNFPFGFVNIAPGNGPPRGNDEWGFPEIRWHQTADYGNVPNPEMQRVFMAMSMDLPDFDSQFGAVHPRTKRDIGDRLGMGAMQVAYGRKVDYTHLYPKTYFVGLKGGIINIAFDRNRELEVRTKDGIEICCSPNNATFCGEDYAAKWIATPIERYNNRSVMIRYKNVCSDWVVGLRYAWKISPCPFKMCALYGAENQLPVPPFITRKVFNSPDPRERNFFGFKGLKKVKIPTRKFPGK